MIERMAEGSAAAVLDAPRATPDPAGPTVGWALGPLGEAQAADREIARQTARRARAVAAFAPTRPASVDRVQGERGAMSAERWAARPDVLRPVSEWAAQELSLALHVTAQRAEAELERSLLLVTRLPRVLAALQAGLLHPVICGACSSTWRRSPMTGCAPGWRASCSTGWRSATG